MLKIFICITLYIYTHILYIQYIYSYTYYNIIINIENNNVWSVKIYIKSKNIIEKKRSEVFAS